MAMALNIQYSSSGYGVENCSKTHAAALTWLSSSGSTTGGEEPPKVTVTAGDFDYTEEKARKCESHKNVEISCRYHVYKKNCNDPGTENCASVVSIRKCSKHLETCIYHSPALTHCNF